VRLGSLRECFRINGRPKIKFTTQDEALAFLTKHRLRGMEVYGCSFGHWHLGHKK